MPRKNKLDDNMPLQSGLSPLGIDDREQVETIETEASDVDAASDLADDANADADRTAAVMPEVARADAEAAQAAIAEATARIEAEGVEIENFISMRTFATQEDLMARVGARPKGTEVALGLIIGVVREFERKASTLPMKPGQEKAPDSIRLKGVFEATVYDTGEIVTATGCYLPAVMGEAIETALIDGALNVRLNMEVSCVSTGRMIPYRFKVRSFIATQEQAAIAAMRMARLRALGRESVIRKLSFDKEGSGGPQTA